MAYNEFHDAADQHEAEQEGGFVGDRPEEYRGTVHEQIVAEWVAGCGAKPEFELVPVRDVNGRYAWGIKEL